MKTKKLKIAFFGSSLVSAYWNGAATYYRGIIKALYKRGHQVTFFEPDAYERQKHRDLPDPYWAKVVVYQPDQEGFEKALNMAKEADVIVKASGVGVLDEELEKAVLDLKNGTNQVVFWDVDAPATLDRVINDPKDHFGSLIPKYDYIFTYGGGNPVKNAYLKLDARECVPIYNALDSETHYPVPPVEKFVGDLAFLGNRLPDREKRVEEYFINIAQNLPQKSFVLGGSGWLDKSLPQNVNYIGHVYTKDHNAFNCTPKAVLNISRQSMADYGYSPATRVFEAAGAGACIITDNWKGIDHFLEPGKEILVAFNGDDIVDILKDMKGRRSIEIGNAARKKVLAKHTYDHRAKQLEAILLEQEVSQGIAI
ncbi:MAG: CgeB family protein [Bacteroidota bacterium]